jgi:hypothetical protein
LSTEESSLSTSKVSLDDFVLLKTVGKGSFVSSDPQYDYSPNEFLS